MPISREYNYLNKISVKGFHDQENGRFNSLYAFLYDAFETQPNLVHEEAGHRLFTYLNGMRIALGREEPHRPSPPLELYEVYVDGFGEIRTIWGDETIEALIPGLIGQFSRLEQGQTPRD